MPDHPDGSTVSLVVNSAAAELLLSTVWLGLFEIRWCACAIGIDRFGPVVDLERRVLASAGA